MDGLVDIRPILWVCIPGISHVLHDVLSFVHRNGSELEEQIHLQHHCAVDQPGDVAGLLHHEDLVHSQLEDFLIH